MPFLTVEQTGGPIIFSLRDGNRYLAAWRPWGIGHVLHEFDIRQLAEALGRNAGETWQEHAALILRACVDGKLFEWLDTIGGARC